MNHAEIHLPGARILGEMTISDLVYRSLRYLKAAFILLVAVLIAGGLSAMLQGGATYAMAYLLIVAGLLPPIALWIYSVQKHIPLVPALAMVNLVWNALPLTYGNPQIAGYNDDEILRASGEIFVFGVVLTVVYSVLSNTPKPRPREYLGFSLSRFQSRRLLLGVATAALVGNVVMEYLIISGFIGQLISRLPAGVFSLIRISQDAIKLSSGFVLGYAIGAGYITGARRVLISACWMTLFTMSLASLLLSSAAGLTISIAAGLYLGSGRIPWKYIAVVLLVVSFFNYSKHEMRKKYWGRTIGSIQFYEMPEYFTEWSYLTVEKLFGDRVTKRKDRTQGLLERVSTLQMLLYVQRMVQTHQIPTLNGATYTMIPKLMVPRILWPEKPRTHEGQVLLNTHFRRQKEADTWRTYIAWGLIAESYGNFGSLLGPVILAVVMGGFLTSVEVWSGNYPLLSIRGAMSAAMLLETLVSYEMTAAVYVTASSQLLAIVGAASILLAARYKLDPVVKRAPARAPLRPSLTS